MHVYAKDAAGSPCAQSDDFMYLFQTTKPLFLKKRTSLRAICSYTAHRALSAVMNPFVHRLAKYSAYLTTVFFNLQLQFC